MESNDPQVGGTDEPVPPALSPPPTTPNQEPVPPALGAGQYGPPPTTGPVAPPPMGGAGPAAGQWQAGGANVPPPPPQAPPGAMPPPNPEYGQSAGGVPAYGAAPYGATGYGPGPVGPRPFSPTAAIAYGWSAFRANVGPLVMIAAVILVVNAIIQWLGRLGGDSFFFGMIFDFVGFLVSLIISLGMLRVALMIVDGKTPTAADLFKTDELGVYIVASVIAGVIIFVGILLCILPGIIAGFLLSLFGYSILDRVEGGVKVPKSSAVGALRTSYEVVTQNVGNLLVLVLLVALINLIGLAACLIGTLVSMPVTAVAMAYAWRYFTNGHIAGQPGSAAPRTGAAF
ncbi:MAG: hypothetical protein ACOYEV_05370 [Candidatus Nanopelagicales bacterium]